jgi:hypothetical protein
MVVGLGTHQEQHVPPARRPAAQLDRRPRELVDMPGDELHDRAPGAVVEQRIGVERRHELGVEVLEHGAHRTVGGHPGVDPAFERDDHDRLVQVGCVWSSTRSFMPVTRSRLRRAARRRAVDHVSEAVDLLGVGVAHRPPAYRAYTPGDDAGELPVAEAM